MPSSSSSFPPSVNRLLHPSQHPELLYHFGQFPWLYTLRSYVFASRLDRPCNFTTSCLLLCWLLELLASALRETRFDTILIHARFDTEPPDVFVSISRRHTAQPRHLLLCPPEVHLGILLKNRDRSCATRSSAKATGTFIRRTTQHSHRVHLGPEQAIFLPGSFPCFSTYRSMSRATSRDREVAFHVIHLVSS